MLSFEDQLKIDTIILLAESSRGELSADFRMVPAELDEADELRLVLLVGEPEGALLGVVAWLVPVGDEQELAVGELAEPEEEASEELLSERADELSAARLPPSG